MSSDLRGFDHAHTTKAFDENDSCDSLLSLRSDDLCGRLDSKMVSRAAWREQKKIRIIKSSLQKEALKGAASPAGSRAFKRQLKHKAHRDVRKLLNISVIQKIVKNHPFTPDLAWDALQMRLLHDDELTHKLEQATAQLEAIQKQYYGEEEALSVDEKQEESSQANAILNLFLSKVMRKSAEGQL